MFKGLLTIAAVLAAAAFAETFAAAPDAPMMRGADAAIGRAIGSHGLVDQDGRPFSTDALLGKPYALSFIYTGCGHTCPLIVTSLKRTLTSDPDFGVKFTAITVGIDAGRDTPKAMRAMGVKAGVDFRKWTFASGDKANIEGITKAAGFYYERSGDGFSHANLVTIVGPDGKVFRQLYGVDSEPKDVSGAILESVRFAGRPAPPWVKAGGEPGFFDKVIFLCYTYDEKTGAYRLDYGFLITSALFIFVQAVIAFIIWHLFVRKRMAVEARRSVILLK